MSFKSLAAAILLLVPAATAASAMPMTTVTGAANNVVQVADGCGRGYHLTPWGACRPNGWRGPPPRDYGGWDRPRGRFYGRDHDHRRGPPPWERRHFRGDPRW